MLQYAGLAQLEFWTLNGFWHREGGPADLVPEGVTIRLADGLDHEDEDPYEGPGQIWAQYGKLHGGWAGHRRPER